MTRVGKISFLMALALIFTFLVPLTIPQGVGAKGATAGVETVLSQQVSPGDKVEISSPYPALQGFSGQTFNFDVDLKYTGKEARNFALTAKGPPEWNLTMQPGYSQQQQEIQSIRLEPGKDYPDRIKLAVYPPSRKLPAPGDYLITLQASAGEVRGSLDLKAVITASYIMGLYSSSGRLNTTANAGKVTNFSILVLNVGSAPLNDVEFNTDKPTDWTTTFTPHRIDSLPPGVKQEITVSIAMPDNTIAGDYALTVTAENPRVNERLNLRITVLTPTLWGWIGVIVVLIVIVGLGVVFIKLGRR